MSLLKSMVLVVGAFVYSLKANEWYRAGKAEILSMESLKKLFKNLKLELRNRRT
jgi:hypothetical protein